MTVYYISQGTQTKNGMNRSGSDCENIKLKPLKNP